MSKLFKFKEWLTVSEAATHLSGMLSEAISEADVLRLALDGHLTLSVNLVNHANAKRGKVVHYSEAALREAVESGMLPADLKWVKTPRFVIEGLPKPAVPLGGMKDDSKPLTMLASLQIDDETYLTLDDDAIRIEGIWDLPMIGAEKLDVEHRCQRLTNGPPVKLHYPAGPFLQRTEGEIWQLVLSPDDDEKVEGSRARGRALEKYITENEMDAETADTLRGEQREARWKLIKMAADGKASGIYWYFPATNLPDDAPYVVRKESLLGFLQRAAEPTDLTPTSTRESSGDVKIIGALLGLMLEPDSKGKPRGGFDNQDRIIEAIEARHGSVHGLKARNLQTKFAAGKRSLKGL